jgi:hypothetical protein
MSDNVKPKPLTLPANVVDVTAEAVITAVIGAGRYTPEEQAIIRCIAAAQPDLPLTQLSQLGEKSEQHQRRHSGSFHYTGGIEPRLQIGFGGPRSRGSLNGQPGPALHRRRVRAGGDVVRGA